MSGAAQPIGFRDGIVDMAPLLIGLIPIALVFGALAATKGMSPLEVVLMSSLVFAGGSQFVALELWVEPLPVLLLWVSALLVNARHMLMGVAIAPALSHWRQRDVYPALFFMVDESWAIAMRRARRGQLTMSYWYALAVVLFPTWVLLTGLGAVIGGFLPENVIYDYGLDFAFAAVFIALLKDFWRDVRRSLGPWLISASVSVAVYLLIPGPWYVAAGAIAGLLVVLFTTPIEDNAVDLAGGRS